MISKISDFIFEKYHVGPFQELIRLHLGFNGKIRVSRMVDINTAIINH